MGRITLFLFVFVLVAALVSNWSLFVENFAALAPDLIAMNALLLGIGLLTSRIAGLDPRSATSVAIGTAVHNGTIGIAVGVMVAGTTSGLPPTTLPTAIYSITVWFLTIPFIFWRRQVASKESQRALV
jgi:BASS family bile acid:Na+ symporter